MNKIIHHKYLPYLIPGLGCLAMGLQQLLLGTRDEKGLVAAAHIGHILAWVIAAIAAAFVCLSVRKLKGPNRYRVNFPPSMAGAIGSFLAAAGIGISLIFFRPGKDMLAVLWLIAGVLSVFCLIITGLCRIHGARPAFFFHGILCLFFALHLVCCCRIWSSETQIERYGFTLLACIGLMLTGYYQSAFAAGIGTRRMQIGISLMTSFFCLAAVPGSACPALYLTGAVWAATNLCVLRTFKRRPRPTVTTEN